METDTKEFLDKLQNLKEDKITIPLRGGNKDFKPLSFKQQKELLSTIAEGQISSLKFEKVLNDIILTNGDGDISIADKLAVVFGLRVGSLGKTFKVSDDVELDLEEYGKVELPSDFPKNLEKTFERNGLRVIVKVPTVASENKVLAELISLVKADSTLSKSVANIYTYEIVKYVKEITFGETIDFSELPVKKRVEIVDNLPLLLNKDIIDFIQSFKQAEHDSLEYNIDGKKGRIEIDINFFNN